MCCPGGGRQARRQGRSSRPGRAAGGAGRLLRDDSQRATVRADAAGEVFWPQHLGEVFLLSSLICRMVCQETQTDTRLRMLRHPWRCEANRLENPRFICMLQGFSLADPKTRVPPQLAAAVAQEAGSLQAGALQVRCGPQH